MTTRTATKELTSDTKGQLAGDLFTGTATTQFTMTDFGFDPPPIAGLLTAENSVVRELTIEAKREEGGRPPKSPTAVGDFQVGGSASQTAHGEARPSFAGTGRVANSPPF
jgi:hypothetical protein